jgi:hypothetical protein
VDIICSKDGAVPLFLPVGDSNASDSAVLGQLMAAFQQRCNKYWQRKVK